MKYTYVPVYYFPSTVIFLDDNMDYLSNLTMNLHEEISFRKYDSAQQAYLAMKTDYKPVEDDFLAKIIHNQEHTHETPLKFDANSLDLRPIMNTLCNPKRFNELSVVVVDYEMPEMLGIEFCRLINNRTAKKILLTGTTNKSAIIQAFNEGVIDAYIEKNDPEMIPRLNQTIASLQSQYFQALSDTTLKLLFAMSPTCLKDTNFIDLFKSVTEQHKIVEYYLIERTGSFLMLDQLGKATGLIIKSQHDLNDYYAYALAHGAPKAILEDLKNGHKIPFFWEKTKYSKSDWEQWNNNLYPAEKLAADSNYYYSIVNKIKLPNPFIKKLTPFQTYLESV